MTPARADEPTTGEVILERQHNPVDDEELAGEDGCLVSIYTNGPLPDGSGKQGYKIVYEFDNDAGEKAGKIALWRANGEDSTLEYPTSDGGTFDLRRGDVTSIEFCLPENAPEDEKFEVLRPYDEDAHGNVASYNDMLMAFAFYANLQEINGLDNLDTSKIERMDLLFKSSFQHGKVELDLEGFDFSHATTLAQAFFGCDGLVSLDLGNPDTSQVKSFQRAFAYCDNLKTIDITGLDLDSCTTLKEMFQFSSSLENITGFDKVFSLEAMQRYATQGRSTAGADKDGSSSGGSYQSMFDNTSLRSIDLSGFSTFYAYNTFDPFSGKRAVVSYEGLLRNTKYLATMTLGEEFYSQGTTENPSGHSYSFLPKRSFWIDERKINGDGSFAEDADFLHGENEVLKYHDENGVDMNTPITYRRVVNMKFRLGTRVDVDKSKLPGGQYIAAGSSYEYNSPYRLMWNDEKDVEPFLIDDPSAAFSRDNYELIGWFTSKGAADAASEAALKTEVDKIDGYANDMIFTEPYLPYESELDTYNDVPVVYAGWSKWWNVPVVNSSGGELKGDPTLQRMDPAVIRAQAQGSGSAITAVDLDGNPVRITVRSSNGYQVRIPRDKWGRDALEVKVDENSYVDDGNDGMYDQAKLVVTYPTPLEECSIKLLAQDVVYTGKPYEPGYKLEPEGYEPDLSGAKVTYYKINGTYDAYMEEYLEWAMSEPVNDFVSTILVPLEGAPRSAGKYAVAGFDHGQSQNNEWDEPTSQVLGSEDGDWSDVYGPSIFYITKAPVTISYKLNGTTGDALRVAYTGSPLADPTGLTATDANENKSDGKVSFAWKASDGTALASAPSEPGTYKLVLSAAEGTNWQKEERVVTVTIAAPAPGPDPTPGPGDSGDDGDDDQPGRPGPDDTGVSDWLDTVNHRAYLSGYGDGSGLFGVDEPMSRAEAATMFYNLLLDKSMGEHGCDFPDLREDAYYVDAVRTLASRGVIMGNGDGTFAPDRAITRAEFVAIAMRFTDGAYDTSGGSPFSDVSESDWFYGPVVGSQAYGWVSGYADGTFGPADTLTRGQATAIVNHMLGRAADEAWAEANPEGVRTFPDVYEGHFAYGEVLEATNSHEYAMGEDGESWTGLTD